MNKHSAAYDAIASVLTYPESDFCERARRCRDLVAAHFPEMTEACDQFVAGIEEKPLHELEELYIQTFDLNPLCTLDTGWQLFGEEYNRGLYMVKVRQEMYRLGVPETTELPDHLTHVLAILGRMEADDGEYFAVACVLPAVMKTLEAIKADNPYRSLIAGTVKMIEMQFGEACVERVGVSSPSEGTCNCVLQEADHGHLS